MKSLRLALAVLVGVSAIAQTPAAGGHADRQGQLRQILENFGKSALTLEQNRGQASQGVDFVALGFGHKFLLSPSGATVQLFNPETKRPYSVKLQMVGSHPSAPAEALDRVAFTSSYFTADDSRGLLRNLPNYAKVKYREVWPGIDIVYYGNRDKLEYDMIVAPQADPRSITIKLTGESRFALNAAGDLELQTPYGTVTHHRPLAFQMIDHQRKEVPAGYSLLAANEVRIQLGEYDRSHELVIDPVLTLSSPTIASPAKGVLAGVDGSGNIYAAVATGQGSVAIVAFNSAGAVQNQGTILGADTVGGMVVTGNKVYLTGAASGPGFPALNGFQTQLADPNGLASDAYFLEYIGLPSQSVPYGTFLGGLGNDSGNAVAVDPSGSAYVTGKTVGGSGFPHTVGAAFAGGATDAFVAKFDPTKVGAPSLIFSTFVGGSGDDSGSGIGVDASGNSYVGGATTSSSASFLPASATGFNTTKTSATSDGFIVKLNPAGTAATYLTFLPSAPVNALAVDSSFVAYVTGAVDGTSNLLATTTGGFQLTNGGNGCAAIAPGAPCTDAFLSKYNTTVSGSPSLLYSTYLGGSLSDAGTGIAVDNSGNAYVVGRTNSSNFPTARPLAGTYQGGAVVDSITLTTQFDAFVAKVNTNDTGVPSLVYSTYLGGTDTDQANNIAIDGSGNAFIGGVTSSTNFPNTTSSAAGTGPHGFFAEVSDSATTLTVSRTRLNFGYSGTLITSPQTVTVNISGGLNVGWTVASDHPNVTVSPASGTGTGTFQVTATPPIGGGTSGAILTVTSTGATGSPQQIHVNVTSVTPSAPFGSFDTPVNNTTGITGAIPVTGWVLDNIEVPAVTGSGGSGVGIWREPVPGEGGSPNGLVFIGNATFVADARPDVATQFPGSPDQYRAGWGYQMLTNFLPNGAGSGPLGNGTYKLHAIVTNTAGTAVDLGTRTITVVNSQATTPFGTIDTPSQGGTASGSAFVNFGWALTQNPFIIPIDGSTITVILDGVAVGHPVYNQFRSDIASLFPGLQNSSGAVGFFFIDTTKLQNKVHTISWNAFDNGARGAGLGSRYFTVLNAGGGGVAAPDEPPTPDSLGGPVRLRSGYDLRGPQVALHPGGSGSYSIDMEQLGRIELSLGASKGYLVVGGQAEDLPLGSTLKAGVFYWQAPLAFLGKYDMVFERPDGTQMSVHVNIVPKSYALQ